MRVRADDTDLLRAHAISTAYRLPRDLAWLLTPRPVNLPWAGRNWNVVPVPGRQERGVGAMKLITAIIKPFKLEEVRGPR